MFVDDGLEAEKRAAFEFARPTQLRSTHRHEAQPDRLMASILLVLVEGTMGSIRPLCTHRHLRRTGRPHYPGGGNLLGCRLKRRPKMRKVEFRSFSF
jgi:hypothetical protein